VIKTKEKRYGQVALPYILLIASVIVEVALAGAFVASFLSAESRSGAFFSRANSAARSAIQDLSLKMSANKDLSGGVYCFQSAGEDKAWVLVSKDETAPEFLKYSIKAVGRAGSSYSQMSADFTVDRITGKTLLENIKQENVSMIFGC